MLGLRPGRGFGLGKVRVDDIAEVGHGKDERFFNGTNLI